MAPSTRRLRARRKVVAAPAKSLVEYPTYDEQHFAEDILLAEQPVVNEPSLEMLRIHRHITLRVGPELAVHYVNAEKLFNQSTYGKQLCSRMSKIPNARSYRVDFPDEEEQVFINLLEWINNGLYNPYKDTFRGSFLRHLKLHTLALKYGVEELAQFTIKVITDMLVESHPEQITRAPFWSAMVNLVYDRTAAGDEMRNVVTGYTLWYLRNGRAKLFETRSNTVENALLALKTLPSTSPFYRIDCTILHENPEYFEEKLNGYFGDTREVNFNTTRWWKDFVEDPLFKLWITYWNMAGVQGQAHGRPDNYEDNAKIIKAVDDEDRILFKSGEEKEMESRKDEDAKMGKSKPKNKILRVINRARATKSKESMNDTVEIGATVDHPFVIQDDIVMSVSGLTPGPLNSSTSSPPKFLSSLDNTIVIHHPLYSLGGLSISCPTKRLKELGVGLQARQIGLVGVMANSANHIAKSKLLKQKIKLEQLLTKYPGWIAELERKGFRTKQTEKMLSETEGGFVGLFTNMPKDLAELGKRKMFCTKLMGELELMRVRKGLEELIGLVTGRPVRMARLVDDWAIITGRIRETELEGRQNTLEGLKRKVEFADAEGHDAKKLRL